MNPNNHIFTSTYRFKQLKSNVTQKVKINIDENNLRKVFFPILSISIIILLHLAVCAKNMDGVEEVAQKRTKVLMICQNHDVPFNFWDPFDPRKWICCNRKLCCTVDYISAKMPHIQTIFDSMIFKILLVLIFGVKIQSFNKIYVPRVAIFAAQMALGVSCYYSF